MTNNNEANEKTKKASKLIVAKIKQLINEKIEREMVQNDAISLPEIPQRDPNALRHHNELVVNGVNEEYFQGDLELADWQAEKIQRYIEEQLMFSNDEKKRIKRKVGKHRIRQALAIWESETCLSFVENGPDVDRLEFFDGGGCSSFVGKTGGTQGISISTPGCDYIGIIAHEVGHALGTFHEQARPDQSRHIAIHYKYSSSVMHYGPYGFASDQYKPTISTLDTNWQSTIGQRIGPSFLDILAINKAYFCLEKCSKPLINCLYGGYPNPNKCSECKCPNGFSGKLCELIQPSPCGATLKISSKNKIKISSPSHPNLFPSNIDCIWLLKAPPGGHVFLQFSSENFYYSCEDTCDKSFIEIKTGPDFRITGYRFCCSIAPTNIFRSSNSELVVIHSGQGPSSEGFLAYIWSDLEWEKKPNSMERTTVGTTTFEINKEKEIASTEATIEPSSTTTNTKENFEITTGLIKEIVYSSTTTTELISTTTQINNNCLNCNNWSNWEDCTQICGGCGKIKRKRICKNTTNCQIEEKRICNKNACPVGTNFLFSNGEFHLLWKGCCFGLFPNKIDSNLTECGPLENNENIFMKIISSLLISQDGRKNRSEYSNKMERIRKGEH
uniref:Zinc metalloproteinase n=1 Tax=Meloidogyne hapla TaxID=6305 RepID=A0A1I8BDC7_MELHA